MAGHEAPPARAPLAQAPLGHGTDWIRSRLRGTSQMKGETMKHKLIASEPPLSEEEFASIEVLRQTAELVNFVWLLAELHGRPEARKMMEQLFHSLASRLRHPTNPRAQEMRPDSRG